MKEKEENQKLTEWLQSLKDYKMVQWEELPEIELYMDQVLGYVDRQLSPLKTGDDKLLTSSMVNNYVKFQTIPKPSGKKYTKSHLGRLFPLCLLKQIMPLPVIAEAVSDFRKMFNSAEAFNKYSQLQSETLNSAAARAVAAMEEAGDNTAEALEVLAFQFAIEATANRIVAERILASIVKKPDHGQGDGDTDSDRRKK